MKVVVSIPDKIFESVDTLAKRLKMPRSKIYALALDEFVRDHTHNDITKAINRALDAVEDEDVNLNRKAARRIFRMTKW